jgi:hypothetical protein
VGTHREGRFGYLQALLGSVLLEKEVRSANPYPAILGLESFRDLLGLPGSIEIPEISIDSTEGKIQAGESRVRTRVLRGRKNSAYHPQGGQLPPPRLNAERGVVGSSRIIGMISISPKVKEIRLARCPADLEETCCDRSPHARSPRLRIAISEESIPGFCRPPFFDEIGNFLFVKVGKGRLLGHIRFSNVRASRKI